MTLMSGIGSLFPLVGAILLSGALNLSRERRYQQAFLPLLSAVYTVVALVILTRFNDWFSGLLESLFALLPVLSRLYQTQWLTIIQNTVVVIVFLVLKALYRALADRLFSGERVFGRTVIELAYEHDNASGRWFLRTSLQQLRVLFGTIFVVSLMLTGVLVVWQQLAGHLPIFSAVVFPALAALLLGEVWYALSGKTKEEADDLIGGEDDAARRVTNYAALRQVLRNTFSERVIDEGVDLANPYAYESHHAVTTLGQTEDGTDRLFAEYFARLKQFGRSSSASAEPSSVRRPMSLDENLMHASRRLHDGVSTVINTPFYADLTEYLALPVYLRLLRGGKCLIVSGRDSHAKDLSQWITEGLEAITGVSGLWNVAVLTEDRDDDIEVGVLRAADVHNLDIVAANDEFLHDVEVVLLVEPSRMLSTGQLGLSLVVTRLARGRSPVFVSIDRNHDGLVDALSHLLKVELTHVIAMRHSLGSSSEIVWSAEGENLANRVLPGVTRYLGGGTELAAVALKYHVSTVEWVGGDKFPVVDMAWIAGQYYSEINAFAEMELSQRSLESSLIARPNPAAMRQTDRRFLVIEDELSNVYESLRLFASRSDENGFINLISESYLLRDYMVDNRELFRIDAKAIPSIVPDFARTPRNTVLKLLLMLSAFEVPRRTVARELELVGVQVDLNGRHEERAEQDDVLVQLGKLAQQALGLTDVMLSRYVRTRSAHEVEDDIVYRLESGTALDEIVRELSPAYFLVEDEQQGRDFIGACLQNHIAQTLLPGQFLTVSGKYYQVQSMGSQGHKSEVILRRAAEHIEGRPVYRHLREFTLSDVGPTTENAMQYDSEQIRVERRTATIEVRTLGYLELSQRDALATARTVTLENVAPRRYTDKHVLRIEMSHSTEQVRHTIAALLNEVFVTVFPDSHMFVVALAAGVEGEFAHLLPRSELAGDDKAIYIVEDSLVDLGLIVAVERHWRRLFETVTDYLAWLHDPVAEPQRENSEPFVFPDETVSEAAERLERIAQAELRGEYETPEQESFWRRVWRRLTGWRSQTDSAASPVSADDLVTPGDYASEVQERDPDQDVASTRVGAQAEMSDSRALDGAEHTSEAPQAAEIPEAAEVPEADEVPEAAEVHQAEEEPHTAEEQTNA